MLLSPPRYVELFQEIKKEYGVLIVRSKPAGADVYINDIKDPAGKTPLIIGCKAGSVNIRVKKGKKEKKEILNVIAGKETASSVLILKGGSSFLLVLGGIVLAGGGAAALLGGKKGNGGTPPPTTGIIQVNSTPTGASVYLDGNDTGQNTNCTLTFVSPGSHTLKLIKEGYEDYEESVSVTAGQTATVSANLTIHTITVTNPTSSIIWVTGDEVEIRWQTSSGSVGFKAYSRSGTGSNPISYPGSNLSTSFQIRGFRHNPAFQGLSETRRRRERSGLSKNEEKILNISSKFQDIQKKSSSDGKVRNIVPSTAKTTGIIERNRSFLDTNLRFSPGTPYNSSRHLPQALKPSGNIRALTLTNVKIELYKADNLVKTISENTENDGTYTWAEVDTSLADGSDYKMRISCVTEPEVYGESDEFQIIHGYEFVTKWGSEGGGDGQFNEPWGVTADSSGYVYVTDNRNHRIQKFTTDGTFVTKWGTAGSGAGDFNQPRGIAVDESSYIYVVDHANFRIQKFTSSGAFVTMWGSEGNGDGQFIWPIGIAADSSGYVYVADTDNNRIQKFTTNGTFVTKWGIAGSGEGQFYKPQGIAADSSGYVYVMDTDNNRIQKFTSDGTFMTKWGSQGSGNGQFDSPEGLAVDSSGYVYVADTYNHRIQKFTSNGGFVTKWGSLGSGDGQFVNPWTLAVDRSGYVYVTDFILNRIQKFGPISGTQGLTGNNSKSQNNSPINNNLDINKNSVRKSHNVKSPLQNRLKNQKNQPHREIRKNERINSNRRNKKKEKK